MYRKMGLELEYCICLVFTVVTVGTAADPCTFYETIDSWERSVANTIGTRCDSLLPEAWYRITSKAGDLMPTECIHGGARCGTGYTVWLNGTYPSDGETVDATACTSDLDDADCCFKSYDIQIKNCSSYYVYKLIPVLGCPQAYCFGNELPCPEGLTSETGFTPGCYSDPCVTHETIDSWERSVANVIGTRCDSLLQEGWYRITSKAGELMPTECIHGGERCGTRYTIWLNGSYPDAGDTVNVTACASHLDIDNCCFKSYDIQIKSCSSFYVYKLTPVDECPQGYCFGSELPCPEGQISDTGFTPGCHVDPCSNYQAIDSWERSIANTIGTRCDSLLPAGWYRITSKAGELMPTECIRGGARCGTGYTIWLNSSYPAGGETVNVKACASDLGDEDCCYKSYDIQIKNCSAFYVYNLVPVNGCPQGYCFGSELPCPDGQTSDTGFTPGCYIEPCQNYKFLPGEDKRSSSYIFEGSTPIDDSELPSGWYRFVNYVGNDIVTSSQPLNRCGTVYPVWMNGHIPSEVNRTFNRTCCLTGLGSSCASTFEIEVRNCGDFRVYNLVQLPNSESAYCFGTFPITTTTSTVSIHVRKSTKNQDNIIPWILAGVALVVCIACAIVVVFKCIRGKTKHSPFVSCSTLKSNPPSYEEVMDNKKNTAHLYDKLGLNMMNEANTKGNVPPYSTVIKTPDKLKNAI